MSECFDLILSQMRLPRDFFMRWWVLTTFAFVIMPQKSIIQNPIEFHLNNTITRQLFSKFISSWLCKREIILKNCITSATFFSLNDISVKKSNLLHSTRWKCLSIFGCILHWNSENVSLFKNKVAKNGASSNQTWYHVPLYLFLRNWE